MPYHEYESVVAEGDDGAWAYPYADHNDYSPFKATTTDSVSITANAATPTTTTSSKHESSKENDINGIYSISIVPYLFSYFSIFLPLIHRFPE